MQKDQQSKRVIAMNWGKLFLSPKGRIGRKDYLLSILTIIIACIAFSIIPIFGELFLIVATYFLFCITSKRLHDFGMSAWVGDVFLVVISIAGAALVNNSNTILYEFFSEKNEPAKSNDIGFALFLSFSAAWLLIQLAFFAWVGQRRGDMHDNAYGVRHEISLLLGSR